MRRKLLIALGWLAVSAVIWWGGVVFVVAVSRDQIINTGNDVANAISGPLPTWMLLVFLAGRCLAYLVLGYLYVSRWRPRLVDQIDRRDADTAARERDSLRRIEWGVLAVLALGESFNLPDLIAAFST